MPVIIDKAGLIPVIPFLGSSFVGILLICFRRTMSRLSRPIAFIVTSSIGASAVLSYIFLYAELTEQLTKKTFLDWNTEILDIDLKIGFLFDKSGSLSLAVISTIIFLGLIIFHSYMNGKKDYISFFILIGFIGSAFLYIPISLSARDAISSFIA